MAQRIDSNQYAQVLGKVVAYYRDKKGLNQKALATKVGVTQTTISRLERGEVQASVFVVRGIASALGFKSVGVLLNRVEWVMKESYKRVESSETSVWLKTAAAVAGISALGIVIASVLSEMESKPKKT